MNPICINVYGVYYRLFPVNKTASVYGAQSNITHADIRSNILYNSIDYTVDYIESAAFMDCMYLRSIYIPKTITSISSDLFLGGNSPQLIEIEPGNLNYDSRNQCNAIIETRTNTLVVGCRNTVIPNSIKTIGYMAFGGCSSLTSITIPNGVDTIEENAFGGCTALKSVELPDSVRIIENMAFEGCSSLTSIQIPKSVKSIGEKAFSNCTSLTSIVIPESVENLGGNAFENCTNLISAVILSKITCINELVFANCSALISVSIPSSVTRIDHSCFAYCSSLVSIVIPHEVSFIGCGVFFECSSLRSINIPINVEYIGYNAFKGTGIYNDMSNWKNGLLYIDNCLVAVEPDIQGECVIDKNTRKIACSVFECCSSITSITIPSCISRIESNLFHNCKLLTKINYLGTKDQWSKVSLSAQLKSNSPIRYIHCLDGNIEIN